MLRHIAPAARPPQENQCTPPPAQTTKHEWGTPSRRWNSPRPPSAGDGPGPRRGLRPPSAPALRRLPDLQPSPTLDRHSRRRDPLPRDPGGRRFHSTAAELSKHEAELPFPLIADPERVLYRRLGVERRPGSLLSPRALGAAIAGEAAALRSHSTKRGALGPVKPTGGRLGLPADFLIAPDGRITALNYGRHAYDQWTGDERLDHARPVPA